jgi:Tfp pilus assembly protein PilF
MAWHDTSPDVPSVAGRRRAWIAWLVPAGTVAATWVVFWPTLRNGFVSWDDFEMFPANPGYQGLGWVQLRWMWTTFHYHEYMPLTWMTYGTDYALWGLDPAGYHLTNLVLHTGAVLAVYVLGRHLLALAGVASATREPTALAVGAGLAALFFAIHPLRAEPVAWVSARGSILGGLFLVLTTLAYLEAAGRPVESVARRAWLTASLGLFLMALLSRSTSVMLPVVLVVLDVYPLRRLGGGWGGWGGWFRPATRRVWWEKVPFAALALAAIPGAFLARRMSGGTPISLVWSQLGDGVAVSLYGLVFYLRKTLVPRDLSPLYERPLDIEPWSWPIAASTLGGLAITGFLVAVRRQWPAALAAWICYVAILLPTSGLLPFGLQLVADRYSYVAGLGWAWLLSAGCVAWWRWWQQGRIGTPVWRTSLGLLAVLFVGLGLLTRQQVQIWRDSRTLWSHVVAVQPESGAAHAALGAFFEHRGDLERATPHYQAAARLWPHDGQRHADLGRVLLGRGMAGEAVAPLHEAVRRMPGAADLHALLGLALAQLGRRDEALRHHGVVVRMDPGSARVWYHLALLCVHLDRLDEAVTHFTKALEIAPGFGEAVEGLNAIGARFQASPATP